MRKKMLRIGIDASRAFGEEPTGTERYSFEVITRLIRLPEAKKHEWILYVKPNFQFSVFNFQSNPNVQIIKIQMPYLWTQVGLAYRTWVDKLDVLWVPAHTLPLLRKPGLKTVVTIHGIEYEWLPAYENALQRWYLPLSTKYAVKSADKIIAVSEFTKKQLVERLGAPAERIQVVHEGVSGTPLTNLPPKLGGRRKWGVLERFGLTSKRYLLFVGTVQPRKNLVRLVEAFAKLKKSELKLVICGKLGWKYDEELAAPKRCGVGERVVFTGYTSDAERQVLMGNALVYVQPSITEGFGLPVLEAMKEGVPVASSRGGALEEVVGRAGKLFDPFDIEDMGRKIVAAMNDEVLVAKGRRRAGEFTWEKATKKTYNILATFGE